MKLTCGRIRLRVRRLAINNSQFFAAPVRTAVVALISITWRSQNVPGEQLLLAQRRSKMQI